jgi:hypothetical protein
MVAYADDVHLQGPPPSAIETFRFQVAATAEIGPSPSDSKCAAYAPSADMGAATAAALGIAHLSGGLVAAGSPLGSDAFVEADARSRAAAVESLVTALTSLPLSTQDKFLLLRLTHLPAPRLGSSSPPTSPLLNVRCSSPPLSWWTTLSPKDLPADPVVAQLALPLRFGGSGLRATTTLEADAAFLAAAGTT